MCVLCVYYVGQIAGAILHLQNVLNVSESILSSHLVTTERE